jgi:hypothetical protein
MPVGKFPAAAYASALPVRDRDHFAAIALRARDPYQAIAAFERQRRRRAA